MLFTSFISKIESDSLVKTGDSVVAAVSGGADSVCLLHLLYRLRMQKHFRLSCAHVNHGLRKEATKDATFVEHLCKLWDIPFFLHETDIAKEARLRKISLELAGREIRYNFLKNLNVDVIMTAHNKNDVAESVLLHLIRGCGLDGLCGIPSKREDGICRPLLSFSREQIEKYLLSHNLSWCVDSTNMETIYTRNKIRHNILPQIEEINPSFVDAIARMTDILTEENNYFRILTKNTTAISKENDVIFLNVNELERMPIVLQRRIVLQAVENFGEVNGVLGLLNKKNGTVYALSGGRIAEKEYDKIVIYTPETNQIEPVKLPTKGEVIFGNYRIITGESGMALPKKEYTVRTRVNGDIFFPEGMDGHKKIKDYFIEKKIPRRLRKQIPIITHGGEIVAVGNLRRSRNFVPTNEDVLYIKIEQIKHV